MTDKELLELAAKAAGYMLKTYYPATDREPAMFIAYLRVKGCESDYPNYWTEEAWNPLTDNGDALLLAVSLGLVVDCSRPSAGEPFKRHAVWLDETMSNAELTRRAIVMAAAEIGKDMK